MHNTNIAPPNQPNVLAKRILDWSLPEPIREAVIGDLVETYNQKQQQGQSHITLSIWYWKQAIGIAYRFMPMTQRGFIMFILSILVFFAMMVFGMVMAAGITAFIDIPSAMLVVPPAIFFAIAATSWRDFLFAFGCAASESTDYSARELNVSKRVFSVLGNTAMWCGATTTLIGWVAMASNITAEAFPNVIGPAFAVSVLTVYYAAIIKVISYVAEQRIANKEVS